MPKTVLLTIGRMPKALEVARALSGAGHRVLVADPFAWHICRISRAVTRSFTTRAPNDDRAGYLDDLLAIIEREGVDLVVPLSEETMHVVGLQDRLPTGVTLYTSDRELVRSLHDKRAFNALAAQHGLSVPATARLGDQAAAELAALSETVIKPVFSCAGMGVQFLARGAELPAAGETPQIVQARVRGATRSSFTVAHRGRVVSTVVYEGTVNQGTVAVAFRRVDDAHAVEAWAERLVQAIEYHGFISLDFIVDAEGVPFAIECNPRATSGVHFLESAGLAAAMLPSDPGTMPAAIPKRPDRHFQQLLNTLTETQGAMFTGKRFRDKLRHLIDARDVVWSRRDPWPFLLMTPVAYQILALSIFQRIPLGEAATRDIGWFRDPPSISSPANDSSAKQLLHTS